MDAVEFAARPNTLDSAIVVTHRHADPDSLGSARGLAAVIDVEAVVYLPDGVAATARPLLSGRETNGAIPATKVDATIVVDTPSWERIAPFEYDGETSISSTTTRGWT